MLALSMVNKRVPCSFNGLANFALVLSRKMVTLSVFKDFPAIGFSRHEPATFAKSFILFLADKLLKTGEDLAST